MSDSSNLLVHLAPAPVVARVATGTGVFRPGMPWLAREVAVCSHLAAKGAPAIRPTTELPPGPHERGGLVMTFWELLDAAAAPVDGELMGRSLREVHEALASFESADLPEWATLDETRRMSARLAELGFMSDDDARTLARVADRERERVLALGLPTQAIHGDAHQGNVMATARDAVWIDFEDAFRGPIGWDLACLVMPSRTFGRDGGDRAEAALAAYDANLDAEALDVLVRARAVQIMAWTAALAPRIPRAAAILPDRLEWLRSLG